ncbi:hypothetical protein BAZOLSSOX_1365 [uncultured Gammaproteobacteria bacterium]|nr:hypothetical protein BAZOLSSOX_1365 [uncultured Gammaproteobacteria bacterium]
MRYFLHSLNHTGLMHGFQVVKVAVLALRGLNFLKLVFQNTLK